MDHSAPKKLSQVVDLRNGWNPNCRTHEYIPASPNRLVSPTHLCVNSHATAAASPPGDCRKLYAFLNPHPLNLFCYLFPKSAGVAHSGQSHFWTACAQWASSFSACAKPYLCLISHLILNIWGRMDESIQQLSLLHKKFPRVSALCW